MSNYPPVLSNVLDHLGLELAQKAFLWAADTVDKTKMKYPAENYALEVKQLIEQLAPILDSAGKAFNAESEVLDSLMRFILRRHLVYYWGERRTYWV